MHASPDVVKRGRSPDRPGIGTDTGPTGFAPQLYFDDVLDMLMKRLHARAPYATNEPRSLSNDGDGIFVDKGPQLVLTLTENGEDCAATFAIGLQLV